jgi:hypothetical protein
MMDRYREGEEALKTDKDTSTERKDLHTGTVSGLQQLAIRT